MENLLDPEYRFRGHGVQTVEKLRVPLFLYYATGDDKLRIAAENAFQKAKLNSLLTGGVVADEFMHGLVNPGPNEHYEYCALTEYMLSLISRAQKTGIAAGGDDIENILFNAAQGARTPDGRAINYFSCDNKLQAVGKPPARAMAYSPTHENAAPCCNPNAARILPSYARTMWMRLNSPASGPGLVSFLYGPCSVTTTIVDARIRLTERTDYPFSESVLIDVSPSTETAFSIVLRVPRWSADTAVTSHGAEIARSGDFVSVQKRWKEGDRIAVDFSARTETTKAGNGEMVVKRGPLYYALAIPERRVITKEYPLSGFCDFDAVPLDEDAADPASACAALGDRRFALVRDPGADMNRPWRDAPLRVRCGRLELVPLGCTLLRRFSFPAD